MWWNDNRANIAFLKPEDSIKLKNVPITTAQLRNDYYTKNRKKDFEKDLIEKCGFTHELSQKITSAMWEALESDSYFMNSIKKEQDTRNAMLIIADVCS